MSGICVWFAAVVLTWPLAFITVFLVPAFMWMTLRWLEDAVAAFRAFTALYRLLRVGKPQLKKMHEVREDLHARIMNLAVGKLNLPEDPESYFTNAGGNTRGNLRRASSAGTRSLNIFAELAGGNELRRRSLDTDTTILHNDYVAGRRRAKLNVVCYQDASTADHERALDSIVENPLGGMRIDRAETVIEKKDRAS